MKNMHYYVTIFFLACILCSCTETEKQRITRLVKKWDDKEVLFPAEINYTVFDKDTTGYSVPIKNYRIVSYIDSAGCTSCKLQLFRWKEFMAEVDSLSPGMATFQFIFHPKEKDKKELVYLLKRDRFDHPVWIDEMDAFGRLNNLPDDEIFHTFLLDSQNRVVVVGNPVHNPAIRELYLKIISGSSGQAKPTSGLITEVSVEQPIIDLGEFDRTTEQQAVFKLQNSGSELLVINDVVTSCGCTTVVYAKEPIRVGNSAEITVTYKADKAEFFNKALYVHCNTGNSPIKLIIKGVAN